jgi:hypothetical protein
MGPPERHKPEILESYLTPDGISVLDRRVDQRIELLTTPMDVVD